MSFPAPCSRPYPPGVENLTGAELARLAANERCRQAACAEVCRRLKNSPDKANYLTARWFLSADAKDRSDAFDGLCRCCWKATAKRIFPLGLYPRTELETRGPNRALLNGSVAKETQEDIRTALVDCLYDLKGLSDAQVILGALNGEFQTDVDVANAVRQGGREQSKYLAYGDDVTSKGDEVGRATLFEALPDDLDRTNRYNEAVEIILEGKAEIVEELGEEGWEVLEEIVELVDNDLLPPTERERERVLTEVFQKAYGVNERQARTKKNQFRKAFEAAVVAGKPVFEQIAESLEWVGCADGKNY